MQPRQARRKIEPRQLPVLLADLHLECPLVDRTYSIIKQNVLRSRDSTCIWYFIIYFHNQGPGGHPQFSHQLVGKGVLSREIA